MNNAKSRKEGSKDSWIIRCAYGIAMLAAVLCIPTSLADREGEFSGPPADQVAFEGGKTGTPGETDTENSVPRDAQTFKCSVNFFTIIRPDPYLIRHLDHPPAEARPPG